MPDKNRDRVLYRPEQHPERNYYSEQSFTDKPMYPTPPKEETEDVIDQFNEMIPVVRMLPSGLRAPIEDLLQKLKKRMEIIRYEKPPAGVVVEPPYKYNPVVPHNGRTPVEPQPLSPDSPSVNPRNSENVTPSPNRPSENTPSNWKRNPSNYDDNHKTTPWTPNKDDVNPLHPNGENHGAHTNEKNTPSDTPNTPQVLPPIRGKEDEPDHYLFPNEDLPPDSHIGTDIYTEPPSISGLPSMFPGPTNIAIQIRVPKSLVQIAQENYRQDQIDLQQYYLQQMQYVLRQYFQAMMMIMAEVGIGDINMLTKDYDGDVVNIPDSNLQHLGDAIERLQVQRNQRTRYFRKVINVDQTLQHMRMWHVSEKERERYYAEAYGDSGTYLDSESNALLRKSRAQYDTNYKSSLYNMYRYLDSSVQVTKDILDMSLQESQAKGKLMKEGVNVFARKETVVENHSESESQALDGASIVEANKGQSADSSSDEKLDVDSSGNSTAASSSSSSDDISLQDYGKPGTATGSDDSHIKAPNGKNYSKNDIKYLTDQGMSQEEAVNTLSKDSKYEKKESASTLKSYEKGYGSDAAPEIAPNGQHYSKNDIQYLTDQGYSREQAIDTLSKDSAYAAQTDESRKKVYQEAQKKLGLYSVYSSEKAPNGSYYENNDIDYLVDSKGYSRSDAIALLSTTDKYKKSADQQKAEEEKTAAQKKQAAETKAYNEYMDHYLAQESRMGKRVVTRKEAKVYQKQKDNAYRDIQSDMKKYARQIAASKGKDTWNNASKAQKKSWLKEAGLDLDARCEAADMLYPDDIVIDPRK